MELYRRARGVLPFVFTFIERPPGVPFQKIQFGTDRAAGVLLYLTPGGAKIIAPLRNLFPKFSPSGGHFLTLPATEGGFEFWLSSGCRRGL